MAIGGQRYFTANPFEVDANGVPLAAGRLFFYLTGTLTPLDTFADAGLTIPNPNPVPADANGRFGTIFLSSTQAYRVQLWTAATVDDPVGSQIWSEDPVGPAAGGIIANTAGIVGEVRQFAGPSGSVPSGWYLCFGQAVSRSTYSGLFSVIGTTYGAGDASTTFNLPDLRGRAVIGKDNMGGTPVNRVTAGVSGVAGATLGAVGGDQHAQEDTLTSESTSNSTATASPHSHAFQLQSTGGGPADAVATSIAGGATGDGVTRNATVTVGVTTATTTTTTSGLTGESQNMPPVIVMNSIIYAGA